MAGARQHLLLLLVLLQLAGTILCIPVSAATGTQLSDRAYAFHTVSCCTAYTGAFVRVVHAMG